ncbi:DNA-directed RNA polymerase subunit A' [archaeon]|nr:DNA-directed RNA polymerase subunit A' [archaeon]
MEYVYKKVHSITFGLLSPKDIKKMSSAKIVTPELYDKEGYPVDGGLMDIRLGVIDPGLRCKVCGGKLKECTGHFGYIELARPVVHINYAKVILAFLRSTCRECSRLLIPQEKIDEYHQELERLIVKNKLNAWKKKVKEIIEAVKNTKKCPHCEAKQIKVVIDKPTTFLEDDKRLSPIEIRTRFEKIPDVDVELFGLHKDMARPEWMILNILLIPPVTMRPSITLETGERSEDDLTHKLGDIVRINQRLFENINAGAPEIIIEDLWDLLQYHITTYFDNTSTQIPPARHRGGQTLKTLSERIKSKEGRFRHNLAGKRVNFSARTVISPDPKIKFNEVGIPQSVALDLTIPERVTEWNIKLLKELMKRGPKVYPGANYVIRPDGKKKKITEETVEQLIEELECGFIVERHLRDGDVSIFNRQPSLHRMSIMCHKIRILPGRSFRLNPSVCNPYNADFDGDEMNLHIPQTEEARAEAEILMEVQTQMITPKNGLNVIGCVEDAVSGNYLLTKDLNLSREDATTLLLSIGITNIPDISENVTGKEVFSALLPNDFDFIGNSKGCGNSGNCKDCDQWKNKKCVDDSYVLIKKGKLLSGIIDKNTIGEDNGALIRALCANYSEDEAIGILGNIFRLGIATLLKVGFTTKLSDSDLPESIYLKIKELIKESERKVQKSIDLYKENKLDALPSKTLEETLEIKILEILNKVRNQVGEIISEIVSEDNPTIIMIKSGSAANILNLTQMAACVGQQALRGKRIEKGYSDRTLSLFKKKDLSPKARGFIENGYKNGLDPVEFFFGAMTGRDSLMDTALRTPKSGYLYRRLANALQDLKIEYDGTLRDAYKTIIQFGYGDDGLDVSKTENGVINVEKIVKNVMGGKHD